MLRERITGLSIKNKELLTKIFDIAVQIHTDKPFDAAHDLDHHLAVTGNILEIYDREKLQGQVDLDRLVCAGLFHDLERGSKEHDLAAQKMKDVGASSEFVQSVISLINEHSFDDKQVSLEGRVLWAADKIEYLSVDRSKKATSKLPPDQLEGYVKIWSERIVLVVEKFKSLGLPNAYNLFQEKFKLLVSYLTADKPEYKHLITELKISV